MSNLFSIIESLADAISRMEGYKPGNNRAWRNHNPGNIWDGLIPGKKLKRIWPHLPIDAQGFVIYPTPEAGREALERQLTIKITRGESVTKLISDWAPPHENNTAAYITFVVKKTGLDPKLPIKNQLTDHDTVPPKENR